MSFGKFLNIGLLGITTAMRQRLFGGNAFADNYNVSVWQNIMNMANNDVGLHNVYTGGNFFNNSSIFSIAREITAQTSGTLSDNNVNTTQTQTSSYSAPLTRMQSTKKNLQSEYVELPFNSNGEIDFDEFTIDKLRTKFPESDYTIEISKTADSELITVKSKENEELVFAYNNIIAPQGNKYKILSFMHDDVPTSLEYQNGKLSRISTYNKSGENYLDDTRELYNENGELVRKDKWNEDNTSYVSQFYSNDIVYKEITFTKREDGIFDISGENKILVEKLIQDITKRSDPYQNGIGFSQKTDEIENAILNDVSKDNVITILSVYAEMTGRPLIQDIIDNKIGLSTEKQKLLLTHLTSAAREHSFAQNVENPYQTGLSIGYEIQFALKNKDTEMLKDALDKVNKDNVKFVLSTIFDTTKGNNFTNVSDKLYSHLVLGLGGDANAYISKLSDAMIQHINEQGGYTKDLEDDMKTSGDWNKHIIDFTRLLNRCEVGNCSTITGKPDGRIDINNIQQGGTGDCWLIAPILSATNKTQAGLDYVNSMLSVDANGNVTVELKGVNKTYVISAEEIEKSNHLSSGDPDMRALEIAVDKYIKEYAYEITSDGKHNFSQADINGDYESFAYEILFGNGYYNENPDIMHEDYNNENQVYSLSFGNNPNIQATVLGSTEHPGKDLISRHAYALNGSDEKYIYLINPHNSAELLQVERELLIAKNPRICHAFIN